tara:strand:- start:7121 stop:7279 length:159 start_codon:yes stop_codon:yes gene_type:complete
MPKKHRLEYTIAWAKENNISKWNFLSPDEMYRKKEFTKNTYNNKKRNFKYDK